MIPFLSRNPPKNHQMISLCAFCGGVCLSDDSHELHAAGGIQSARHHAKHYTELNHMKYSKFILQRGVYKFITPFEKGAFSLCMLLTSSCSRIKGVFFFLLLKVYITNMNILGVFFFFLVGKQHNTYPWGAGEQTWDMWSANVNCLSQ